MAKITITSIDEELSKYGWLCTSTKYVNLDTPLSFRCNEGHEVVTTWGKLRNKIVCPVCKNNVKKNIVNIQSKPKTSNYRILALDQSSHKTGYSIYDGNELISYGVYESTKSEELDRIKDVCDWLDSMIVNWKPDEVGLEETQYNPNSGMGHDVFKLLSQVMGAIMITAARAKCKVSKVLIPTWRHYAGVKGNTRPDQKRSAQMLVKKWHDVNVTDDEADAICIGKYFADQATQRNNAIGDFEF